VWRRYRSALLTREPAEFSADGTTSLRGAKLSPDGKWLAYGVSQASSDWMQLRVRSVDSGADTADVASYAKFVEPVWSPDSAGFFVSRGRVATII
jgi:prolyl oligopeptidase